MRIARVLIEGTMQWPLFSGYNNLSEYRLLADVGFSTVEGMSVPRFSGDYPSPGKQLCWREPANMDVSYLSS